METVAATETARSHTETIEFDDRTPKAFLIASIFWGIIGMTVGALIAFQLNFWQMNGKFLEWITFGKFHTEGISFLTFGRLRPLHTNAVIFAFVGNMMFSGIYYSTQRLCKCRTASDLLSKIHFWGWQLIIVSAALTLPAGLTQGQEYAELIWPIDLAVAAIWVVFAVNFFWTLHKRNEPSLYVAIWFYIATIITIAMLYIVNNLQVPTALLHSYPVFGGVQNALVQWWYGHNAVAFFLTTPILGIMYYYLPKAAGRPVYSYRLSIVHFWSLVFIYIWAGPHHLLNTSLPKWLQLSGMFFSLMLWAPSWGGMLNGLLTLRGAWDKLRTDPVIKFFVAGVTFYGMSTFEGPLLSIRAVNALSHNTDWTIGHVHSGALGWNGFMAAGMFYWLAPRLWRTKLWRTDWANFHFWIGLTGILIYVAAMWFSGIMQQLMLNTPDESGTALKYEFITTVDKIAPFMLFRAIGGTLYLTGMILMAINIWKTAKSGSFANETREVAVISREKKDIMRWGEVFRNDPIAYTAWGLLFGILWFFLPPLADVASLLACCVLVVMAVRAFKRSNHAWADWYERLAENWMPFTVLVLIAVAIGGAIQIIPTATLNSANNVEDRKQVLYTPLELAGRDIFVGEGCYNCHTQMVRTLVPDVMRYGDYSRLGESIYDHPFQWGSKRTGPDLAREGGRRSDKWHYAHMMDPRMNKGSRMPSYHVLYEAKTDIEALPSKIKTQRTVGVPYPAMSDDEIIDQAKKQAQEIAMGLIEGSDGVVVLKDDGTEAESREEAQQLLEKRKIIALIAYLQKIGTYEELAPKPVDPTINPIKPGLPDDFRKYTRSPVGEEPKPVTATVNP
ncbi:MAG: cytochrome-c oxidase, cbb3-type subunit I [Verrucomicrobiae bacterium]|nr:cytochrome-c oxidase, cbb3-type subunit I [Verrucomicrobiae bacterium]